jgi:hypothetical protein
LIRALGLALAVALAAGGAGAQTVAGGEPPDVPRGDGVLRGRVVRGAGGEPLAGVEVLLYALPAEGQPGLRRGASGAEGRFAFEGIDRSPTTTYLVGARFGGVSYPGARVQFGGAEPVPEVEVRVHDVTDEAGATSPRELRVRIDWMGDRLEVSEELDVGNPGPETVYVPAGRRAARPPVATLGVPAGARDLTGPLGIAPEGLALEGDVLRWFGPVLPGGSELVYGYTLPAPVGTLHLERALPRAPLRVTLLAPSGGPTVQAPALREGEATVVAGRGYRSFSGEVGGRLALELTLPAARHDRSAVSLAEMRILGELDAAAFVAREELVIEVAGDAPVVAEEGAPPLLAIPLPEGASDLRFGAPESGTRLVPLADGSGIGVLGPLAPGETLLDVRYRLPAAEPFTLTRRVAARVPLLSVYVADTGNLQIASERLHRRRPARTPDRTYLHLEAFELAPGEEVAVRFAKRPPRRELPRTATAGFVALATGLAALALAGPLRRAPGAGAAEGEERESPAAREREALRAALGDLEHDFETGKLEEADYAPMRAELEARVAGLLEEAGPAAPAQDATAPAREAPACPGCGHAPGPEDRFCARCGLRLA